MAIMSRRGPQLVKNQDERDATLRLLRKYADTPMSFADACLVRMSELRRNSRLFTLDQDFAAYRRNGRGRIPLLAPWQGAQERWNALVL